MARIIAGERTLRAGGKSIPLRLTIGTIMDLEDHFDASIFDIVSTRLAEGRMTEVVTVYTALSGRDITCDQAREAAGAELIEAGLVESMAAISACLQASLNPVKMPKAD